jgi:GDP-L-fucose synthase
MDKSAKIFIAGHKGLVGSAIYRQLSNLGYKNLITKSRSELDLLNYNQVENFYETHQPDYVFICAARVGGILANNTFRGEFIYQNLSIQNNLIHLGHKYKVKRLLYLGSSCIYPKNCPQPIKEEYLLSGPLEFTNRPYALAKISGIEMCWSYNLQYGTQFCAVMPTNLYGPNDNFDLNTGHVLPSLIRKVYEAQRTGKPSITVWGTGNPRREFLHVDDMARAVLHVMNLEDSAYQKILNLPHGPFLNIGVGQDVTIKELAEMIISAFKYQGKIDWDRTKPDGTPRKLLEVSKIFELGWNPEIALDAGIQNLADSISTGKISFQ